MFPHGLMFHHFHNDRHPRGQGAISADEFNRILDRYEGRILPAVEWAARVKGDELQPTDVCLTFDDALRCQIDVALPVLKERGMTAFWFVFSSVFQGNVETLELFRFFRTVAFKDFDDFSAAFLDSCARIFSETLSEGLSGVEVDKYLAEFPFYTHNDRLFRYVRDRVLTTAQYDQVMFAMMRERSFDQENAVKNLWMADADLLGLAAAGHVVGLHSYTHPIRMENLPVSAQREEYAKNHAHINQTIKTRPSAVSHPCNSYNHDTLAILKNLGVDLGFCSNMSKGAARSKLEIPREDHANILAAMQ